MKKFKLLSLSLVATLSLGFTSQIASAQMTEIIETQPITQVADEIFVRKVVPFTTEPTRWATEVRNGKTYSGLLYNRGVADKDGRTVAFTGYLIAGPHAPNVQDSEK